MTAARPSRTSSPSRLSSFSLSRALRARVVVQRARQRGLEAGEMRPALVGVDVVGEREDRLLVGVVPLHRDLDLAVVGGALEVDDVLVRDVLRLVDVADEVLDAAFVVELDELAVDALVGELDAQALRQERRLTQPGDERRRMELGLVEDRGVGEERDRGARSPAVRDERSSDLGARRARTPGGRSCRRARPLR